MKTYIATPKTIINNWYCIDVNGKTLGRISTAIVKILLGKHKPEYTPHIDTGDYIIVLNAKQIKLTGGKKKLCSKTYYHHTGYIGGIKKTTFKDIINLHPERVIEIAVKGMLPKGTLGRAIFRKLKVYPDDKHPHISQQPKFIDI